MKFSYPEKEGSSDDLKFKNQYGHYLISEMNTWHGGIHIENKDRQVLAIADGRIIAYRYASEMKSFPKTELLATTKEEETKESEQKEAMHSFADSFVLVQHDLVLTKPKEEEQEQTTSATTSPASSTEEVKATDETIEKENSAEENSAEENYVEENSAEESKVVTFYSLYHQLLPIDGIIKSDTKGVMLPEFISKAIISVKVKKQYSALQEKFEGLNARKLTSEGKIKSEKSGIVVVIPKGESVRIYRDENKKTEDKGKYRRVIYTDPKGKLYDTIYICIKKNGFNNVKLEYVFF